MFLKSLKGTFLFLQQCFDGGQREKRLVKRRKSQIFPQQCFFVSPEPRCLLANAPVADNSSPFTLMSCLFELPTMPETATSKVCLVSANDIPNLKFLEETLIYEIVFPLLHEKDVTEHLIVFL